MSVDMCGIYLILNLITNQYYVGSSVHCSRRITQHFKSLRQRTHINTYLQNSFNKYGESNFEGILLESCFKEQKLFREQFWIDNLESSNPVKGFNLTHSVVSQAPSILRSQISKKYWAELSEEDRRRDSEKRSILWEDPEWRKEREKDLKRKSDIRLEKMGNDALFKSQCMSGFEKARKNPEKESERIAKIKKAWQDPERKAKQSSRKKALSQDPKYREAHLERIRRPEVRAKLSEHARNQYKDPVIKEIRLNALEKGRNNRKSATDNEIVQTIEKSIEISDKPTNNE